MPDLDVRVDRDEGCFDLPEWRQLLDQDPNRHIFATPEWNRVWWEEFSSGKDPLTLTLFRDGDVVALVPLYRKVDDDRKVIRFIGGIDLTDYLGPICSRDDRGAVAESLVDWLTTTDVEWDEFDAHNMPVPFGFGELLVETVDRKGLVYKIEQEDTSAVLPLSGTWDDYLMLLSSKERHELKRKIRRLGREHPDATVRTATSETLGQDLKTFVEMHRGAEGLKGHFMRPEIATFFERVAKAFLPLGWLRLDLLELGGSAIASTFSFEFDRTFYLYNSAFEPEASRLSPGVVLVAELVKDAVERGFTRFDFLRGPERYKYQLGGQAVPLNNVRVMNERLG